MRYIFAFLFICMFAFSCVRIRHPQYPDYRDPQGRDYPTTGQPEPVRREISYRMVERCIAQMEAYKFTMRELAQFSTNHPPYASRQVEGIELIYHKPYPFTARRGRTHRWSKHSRLTFIDRSEDLRLTIRFIEDQRKVLGVETADYCGVEKKVDDSERAAIYYLRKTNGPRYVPLKADEVSRILGKSARELTPEDIAGVYVPSGPRGSQTIVAHSAKTVKDLPRHSPVRQRVERAIEEMRAYLAAHRMQIFRTRDRSDYAFAGGKHCPVATGWGGSIGHYRLHDFDANGAADLRVDYEFGSGMVRPNSTIVLDRGQALSVFRINGSIQRVNGKMLVYHPLQMFKMKTASGRQPAVAGLVFSNGVISAAWPPATRSGAKWSVVHNVEWTSDPARAGGAAHPPIRRRTLDPIGPRRIDPIPMKVKDN